MMSAISWQEQATFDEMMSAISYRHDIADIISSNLSCYRLDIAGTLLICNTPQLTHSYPYPILTIQFRPFGIPASKYFKIIWLSISWF
jgi:hypothetical protein